MTKAPETRPSLLVRIREARDAEAWSQFVDIYAPLIYRFARRHGLQDADAADLAQEVLWAIAKSAGQFEYNPQRGSFRNWLFTVARNRLRNSLERRDRSSEGTGDTGVQRILENAATNQRDSDGIWEDEYQRQLFGWAAQRIRECVDETTWRAFWQTAVEGKKPLEVARSLGMTLANVYRCKSRVVIRIKELVRQVEEL